MALSDILSRFRQSDAEYDEEGYEDEGYDTSSSAVTQAEAEGFQLSPERFRKDRSAHKVRGDHEGAGTLPQREQERYSQS